MLKDLSANTLSKLIVRYHRDWSELYPDEISVVNDNKTIQEILDLLHLLPQDGDHFDVAPAVPEYFLLLFRSAENNEYDENAIDRDNDIMVQMYGKKIQLENDDFLSSDDWNEIQEKIYTILKSYVSTLSYEEKREQVLIELNRMNEQPPGILSSFAEAINELISLEFGSEEWLTVEQKAIAALKTINNDLANEHIEKLCLPLEMFGGTGLSHQLLKSIGGIGTTEAFSTVLGVLKECSQDSRGDILTATLCSDILYTIDSERSKQEDVDKFVELVAIQM